MRVENLVMFAKASFILTYKPDIFSALEIYRTDKQFASADDWEEQSGNGGDQQVLQHQHGSAVPTI